MSDILVKKGKELSYLLRHDKEAYDEKKIDKNGWRNVSELIEEFGFTKRLINDIVSTNDKKRYELNEYGTKIRARQGHSIPVNVELKEWVPPTYLYHGTASRFVGSIMKEGIKPQTRLYVHLSKDVETATKVGSRHGSPVILKVHAKEMYEDGIKFYLSNNGVWLTEYVDTKYIEEV